MSDSRNKIEKFTNYAKVKLTQNKFTIIDIESINIVKKFRWHLTNCGYARCWVKKGKGLMMHRLVMQTDIAKDTDHIDGNKLNNRKNNLRICSRRQNCRNRKNVLGMYFEKDRKKWKVYIGIKGKVKTIGRFLSKEDAIEKRKIIKNKFFKKFACNN